LYLYYNKIKIVFYYYKNSFNIDKKIGIYTVLIIKKIKKKNNKMTVIEAPNETTHTTVPETTIQPHTETVTQESKISEYTDKFMKNLPSQHRVKSSIFKVLMPDSGSSVTLSIDEHNKDLIQDLYTSLLIQSAISMFLSAVGMTHFIFDWLLLIGHFFLSKRLGRFDTNLSSIQSLLASLCISACLGLSDRSYFSWVSYGIISGMLSVGIWLLISLSRFEKIYQNNSGVTKNVAVLSDNTIEASLSDQVDSNSRSVYEINQKDIKMYSFILSVVLLFVLFVFSDLHMSLTSFLLTLLVSWLFTANSLNLIISRINMDDLDTELRGANGKKMVLGMSWFMLSNIVKSIIE
jgi:hypothetical protein